MKAIFIVKNVKAATKTKIINIFIAKDVFNAITVKKKSGFIATNAKYAFKLKKFFIEMNAINVIKGNKKIIIIVINVINAFKSKIFFIVKCVINASVETKCSINQYNIFFAINVTVLYILEKKIAIIVMDVGCACKGIKKIIFIVINAINVLKGNKKIIIIVKNVMFVFKNNK